MLLIIIFQIVYITTFQKIKTSLTTFILIHLYIPSNSYITHSSAQYIFIE